MARAVHCRAPGQAMNDRSLHDGGGMRGLLRTLLAGWGAKKMGGGCISTIIIFLILWFLLRGVGV